MGMKKENGQVLAVKQVDITAPMIDSDVKLSIKVESASPVDGD
jgi:hypothetical protein